jgi:hypothetical protein
MKMKFLLSVFIITSGLFSSRRLEAAPLKIGMKILILVPQATKEINLQLDYAENALRGYGIPFDIKTFRNEAGLKNVRGSLNLRNSDGTAKYYGIIRTENLLRTTVAGKVRYSLTALQAKELARYQRKFRVRSVSLSSLPAEVTGMAASKVAPATDDELQLDHSVEAADPALVSGLSIGMNGLAHFPGEIVNTKKLQAFSYFKQSVNGVMSRSVSGVVESVGLFKNLHLFVKPALDSPASLTLATAWINWLTQGLFVGQRRIYLNVHVDDMYLPSRMNTVPGVPDSIANFRISDADLEYFVQSKNTDLLKLTENPDYKIEIAFNGKGIFEHGGYGNDKLYLKSKERLTDYYWVTHTYSHLLLNTSTFEQTDEELKNNIAVAKVLMHGHEDLYSWNSMVTPGISGLFNKPALKAMKANGIYHIVGDNSLPELLPPNPQSAYWTTEKVNNEPGVLIMPREATNIDWNVSLPEESVKYYRETYPDQPNANFDDVMNAEAKMFLPNLLNYREVPYMFHQANMRVFDRGGQKDVLLILWMKNLLSRMRKSYTLPVLSVKMDDLAAIYLNKMALEKCKPEAYQVVNDGKVEEIQVSASGSCDISISATGDMFQGAATEIYGPDQTIKMDFSSAFDRQVKTIRLKRPLALD